MATFNPENYKSYKIEKLTELYMQEDDTGKLKQKENYDSNNFLSPRFIAKNEGQESWITNTPNTIP